MKDHTIFDLLVQPPVQNDNNLQSEIDRLYQMDKMSTKEEIMVFLLGLIGKYPFELFKINLNPVIKDMLLINPEAVFKYFEDKVIAPSAVD